MPSLLQPTSGLTQPPGKQLGQAVVQPPAVSPSQRVATQVQPAAASAPQVGTAQAMDPMRVAQAATGQVPAPMLPNQLMGPNMMQQLPGVQPGAMMPNAGQFPPNILQQVLGTIIGQPQASLGSLITGGRPNGL